MTTVEATPATTTAASDPELLERELADETSRLARKLRVPGVAVGVELDGARTYSFHGVTSIDNPLPVDSRTLFQIGSNTKTFTATALMRLVERGDVDLQATVRTYIPEFRVRDEAVSEQVKVLQLFNHTAGWTGDFFVDTGPGDDALAGYVRAMSELEQLHALGAQVSYNNASFSTAGHVIERVTGLPFEQAVRELVLEPLGLQDTVFPPDPVLPRRFAAGHYVTADGLEVARKWLLPRAASAAGTLLSTPADMLRYARFHRSDGEGILSRESLDRMKRPTTPSPGSALGDEVGISWLLRDLRGLRVVGHGGGTNGQLSAFLTVPERGFALAILTNASSGAELHGDLAEWILQKWLGVEPVRYERLETDLAAYAGTYRTPSTTVTLEMKDGDLQASFEPTEKGRRWGRVFAGEQAELTALPPLTIEVLEGERIRAKNGSPRPVGAFVRRDGDLTGLTFGGRLGVREGARG